MFVSTNASNQTVSVGFRTALKMPSTGYLRECTHRHVVMYLSGYAHFPFKSPCVCVCVCVCRACQMDLHAAIKETQCALNLVLNNRFSEALDLLKPW